MSLSKQRFKHLSCALLFTVLPLTSEIVLAENPHAGHQNDTHEERPKDWPGVYQGFLPCDDCIGIKTTLGLNKNGSYVLITQNVGKSPRDFVEKGKYSWAEQADTILLKPKKAGKTTQLYLVEKDRLIRLDDNGKRHGGKLADRYILRRNDVTETATSPSHGH